MIISLAREQWLFYGDKGEPMRLFISINPDEKTQKRIASIVQQLKQASDSGRFTSTGNLHLTLVFIGETSQDQIKKVQTVMDSILAEPFTLTFSTAGSFSGRDGHNRKPGDIWWLGIDDSPELIRLQRQLAAGLRHSGFTLENRIFKPHLTIGRSVRISESSRSAGSILHFDHFELYANHISLMSSHRVENLLTYSEIYKKQF
jgi:2'-5' RNA ligase